MYVDAWLTAPVTIDFKGASMEACTQLMNYCTQNKLGYKCKITNATESVEYEMAVNCTNETAYTLIRDYKNRGGN